MPPHVVTWDIDAPIAKRRPWAANVAAFSTEQRAAAMTPTLYLTCGAAPRGAPCGPLDEVREATSSDLTGLGQRAHGPGASRAWPARRLRTGKAAAAGAAGVRGARPTQIDHAARSGRVKRAAAGAGGRVPRDP